MGDRRAARLGKPCEPNAIIKNDIEYILMERKPGGYRKPTEEQRQLSMIPKDKFDRWFQQFWNLTGASTKEHPAPFPLELASRLVQMFSFVGDTVLDPFCGTGTTMVAALKARRNSIGIELDTEYCRMAASRLMNENTSLFSHAELQIQLHTPAIVTPQDVPAPALHDSGPAYRTKLAKKTSRLSGPANPNSGACIKPVGPIPAVLGQRSEGAQAGVAH
jgi:DNA modification methylase